MRAWLVLIVACSFLATNVAGRVIGLKIHGSSGAGSSGEVMDIAYIGNIGEGSSVQEFARFTQSFQQDQEYTATMIRPGATWSEGWQNSANEFYLYARQGYTSGDADDPAGYNVNIKVTKVYIHNNDTPREVGDFDIQNFSDDCGTKNGSGKRSCLTVKSGFLYKINLNDKKIWRYHIGGMDGAFADANHLPFLQKNACLRDLSCQAYPPVDPDYSVKNGCDFSAIHDPNMYYTVHFENPNIEMSTCYLATEDFLKDDFDPDPDGKQIWCMTDTELGGASQNPQAHWRFVHLGGYKYEMRNRGTGRVVQVGGPLTNNLKLRTSVNNVPQNPKVKSVYIRGITTCDVANPGRFALFPDFNDSFDSWDKANLGQFSYLDKDRTGRQPLNLNSNAGADKVQTKHLVHITALPEIPIRSDTILVEAPDPVYSVVPDATRDIIGYALSGGNKVSAIAAAVTAGLMATSFKVLGPTLSLASVAMDYFSPDNSEEKAINALAKALLEDAYGHTHETVARQQVKDANDKLHYATKQFEGSFQHLKESVIMSTVRLSNDPAAYVDEIEHVVVPTLLAIINGLVLDIVIDILDASNDATDPVTYAILEGGWNLVKNAFAQAAIMVLELTAIQSYIERMKEAALNQTPLSCGDIADYIVGLTGFSEYGDALDDAIQTQWTRYGTEHSFSQRKNGGTSPYNCYIDSSYYGRIYNVNAISQNNCNSIVDSAKALYLTEREHDFLKYSYEYEEVKKLFGDPFTIRLVHFCEQMEFYQDDWLGLDVSNVNPYFPATTSSHYIQCGQSGRCGTLDTILAHDDEVHEFRCCRTSTSGFSAFDFDWYPLHRCHKAKYAEAMMMCESENARLCTISEIEGGAAVSTGCGYDAHHIWTSDSP